MEFSVSKLVKAVEHVDIPVRSKVEYAPRMVAEYLG